MKLASGLGRILGERTETKTATRANDEDGYSTN